MTQQEEEQDKRVLAVRIKLICKKEYLIFREYGLILEFSFLLLVPGPAPPSWSPGSSSSFLASPLLVKSGTSFRYQSLLFAVPSDVERNKRQKNKRNVEWFGRISAHHHHCYHRNGDYLHHRSDNLHSFRWAGISWIHRWLNFLRLWIVDNGSWVMDCASWNMNWWWNISACF